MVCATGIGSREFGQERVWLSQRGERFSWHLQDVGTNVHCGPLWVFSSILATVCCGSNSKIKLYGWAGALIFKKNFFALSQTFGNALEYFGVVEHGYI